MHFFVWNDWCSSVFDVTVTRADLNPLKTKLSISKTKDKVLVNGNISYYNDNNLVVFPAHIDIYFSSVYSK